MELQGEQIIRATRERVWQALNDPAVLVKCLPGCESIDKVSDTESHARMLAKIGPVRARFDGRIKMSEIDVPAGCTLSFEGSGGAAGMAKGKSVVTLLEQPDGTCLRYTVQASVGGKLGQIGGRLIDASAKKMADDFFRAFNEQLTPQGAGPYAADDVLRLPGASPSLDPSPSPRAGPDDRAVAPARPPAPAAGAPVAWHGGFFGEGVRLLWLAIGLALGGLIGHLWHF